MKLSLVFLFLLIIITSVAANGQVKAIKYVTANGGGVKPGNIFSSATVIGESVIGRFSTGSLSGTVGYLDEDDLLPTYVVPLSPSTYQIKVFPNPNDGAFKVIITAQQSRGAQILLQNAIGQTVELRRVQLQVGENLFLYTGIGAGTYFINVMSETALRSEKVIVK